MADSATAKSKKTVRPQEHKTLKKLLRHTLIHLISLSIVILTFALTINTLYGKFFKPVDPEDDTLISVEVPMGTTVNGIADILYENGLIRNEGAFKLMVDLSNKSNKMQAGKYELSKSMTLQEMIDELLTGQVSVTTVKITIREGDDVRKIASRLVNEYKLDFTEEEFINETKQIDKYISDYPFLRDIPEARKTGQSPMEGYLFPDTYYVFADAKPEAVIRTLLGQFDFTFSQEMREQAEDMGLSMDEVVTLASIIQNEGKNEDFAKISAVFHNRMRIGMKLESCATINYVLDKDVRQTNITIEDTKVESPYNTYQNQGLPIGPISSPGKAAMEAALNPFVEFMDEDEPMLYFVLMDPQVGLHAFNSTYEGHVKDKAKYQELWN
jgi:UPF0755 protein